MLVAWRTSRKRAMRGTATLTSLIRSSATGPICCSSPIRNISDRSAVGRARSSRSPAPPGVVQPLDPDRPSRWRQLGPRAARRELRPCSTGPTGSSRCSTPSAASAHRSSRDAGHALPVMLLAASHPDGCVHSCCGVRSRGSFAHPITTVRHSRVTRFRIMSTTLGMRLGTGATRRCACAQLGAATRPSGGGGPAVSASAGGPGLFRRRWSCGCALDVRHALDSIQAPTLLHAPPWRP